MLTILKELHAYSCRSHRAGSSPSATSWSSSLVYLVRMTRAVLFGYNPNLPFPVTKGNERRGLVGEAIFDLGTFLREMVKFLRRLVLWLVISLVVGLVALPQLTIAVVTPVVSPLWVSFETYIQRLGLELDLSDGIEVREGLYVFFPQPFDAALTERVLEIVRRDDSKVESQFGQAVTGPILIRVTPTPEVGREPGTITLGHYVTQSLNRLGAHSIEISLIGVLENSTVAHELTHMRIGLLNPTLNTCLNEGLAHFMQSDIEHPSNLVEDEIDTCSYPSARHWSVKSSRSRSDSQATRALGYVVVHYLHRVKGVPIKKIPVLSERELPTLVEIHDHLRTLKLQVAKDRALRMRNEDIDLDFWQGAYLGAQTITGRSVEKSSGTVADAVDTFQNFMDLSVQHLRWSGMSDDAIAKMSPHELMKMSGEAISKLDSRVEQLGLRFGEQLYWTQVDGIYDAGLERLLANRYEDDREGRLLRAIDQGWARVYAGKKLPNRESLPQYSPALLQAVHVHTGAPSPARDALNALEHRSLRSDALKRP